MKNIFFVINKEKIYAFVVSVMTVVTIFAMTSMINTDLSETDDVSANIVKDEPIGEAISTGADIIEDNNTVNQNVN